MTALVLLLPWLLSQQPPTTGETLQYSINWPSGLSLGESRLESRRAGDRWEFSMSLQADLPGASARDRFRSVAREDFCSLEFEKDFTNGKRRGHETTTFDLRGAVATRVTRGGGQSRFQIPACPHDALAFLYFLRHELAQGRLPPPQTVYFGAAYEVRVQYGGVQDLIVQESPRRADRLTVSVKGPASTIAFELFFAQDAARTPLLVRVPLPSGTFCMELVR